MASVHSTMNLSVLLGVVPTSPASVTGCWTAETGQTSSSVVSEPLQVSPQWGLVMYLAGWPLIIASTPEDAGGGNIWGAKMF